MDRTPAPILESSSCFERLGLSEGSRVRVLGFRVVDLGFRVEVWIRSGVLFGMCSCFGSFSMLL